MAHDEQGPETGTVEDGVAVRRESMVVSCHVIRMISNVAHCFIAALDVDVYPYKPYIELLTLSHRDVQV